MKNKLSKDIYNEMLKLEKLKVKHKIITTKDDYPTALEQAINKLRQAWAEALYDEEEDERKGLSTASKKAEGKGKSVK